MIPRNTARNRANQLLASVVIGSAILLALLWPSHRASTPLDPAAPEPVREPEARSPMLLAMERPASERSAADAPDPVPEAQPQEPTYLFGRMTLDGKAVEGGGIHVSSADGVVRRAAIDFEGRFRLKSVPIEALTLTIELPLVTQRIVLPPTLELTPEAGKPLELELAWASKQVNLRVLDERGSGLPARVEVRGPRVAASIETGLDGTAKLTLLEAGQFRFHALTRSGLEGEAELELEPVSDLSSVVVVVALPAPASDR